MSSMELIKKLRDATGSGIVDCKKALSENNNDIDASVKWLREKGILKAQKKQDRETNEGVVSFYNNESNTNFTVCKIKCETDFVAKNNDFLDFAKTLSKAIHENKDINDQGTDENLDNLIINNKKFSDCLTDLISKIGENIQVVSYKKYNSEKSIFISYLHNKYNSSLIFLTPILFFQRIFRLLLPLLPIRHRFLLVVFLQRLVGNGLHVLIHYLFVRCSGVSFDVLAGPVTVSLRVFEIFLELISADPGI